MELERLKMTSEEKDRTIFKLTLKSQPGGVREFGCRFEFLITKNKEQSSLRLVLYKPHYVLDEFSPINNKTHTFVLQTYESYLN